MKETEKDGDQEKGMRWRPHTHTHRVRGGEAVHGHTAAGH